MDVLVCIGDEIYRGSSPGRDGGGGSDGGRERERRRSVRFTGNTRGEISLVPSQGRFPSDFTNLFLPAPRSQSRPPTLSHPRRRPCQGRKVSAANEAGYRYGLKFKLRRCEWFRTQWQSYNHIVAIESQYWRVGMYILTGIERTTGRQLMHMCGTTITNK